MLQRVQTPFQECLIPPHIQGHYKERRKKKKFVITLTFTSLWKEGRRCGNTHYVHVMISGNVGIAVMPRENPIIASMRTSNHR